MTSVAELPERVELIEGKLAARIYAHDVESMDGPVPCWTYITEGLLAHGQEELIFTLAREPQDAPEAFVDAPLRLFIDVHRFAEAGNLVRAGGRTQLQKPEFLGHRSFVYVEPTPLPGIEITDPSIAMILLKDEEYDVYERFGLMRVLSNLGRAYRYYPWPPWSDPSRPVLPVARDPGATALSKLPVAQTQGITVRQEDGRVVMGVLPEAGRLLRTGLDGMPADAPACLLTDLDPTADSCLVWSPGQTRSEAISRVGADGSRTCGCFIAFVPQQENDGGRVWEDGFGMLLTDESWSRIRQGLENEAPVSIDGSGDDLGFTMEWIPDEYVNPVDGRTYSAGGSGWRTFRPDGGERSRPSGPCMVQEANMLVPESALGSRVGVNELSDYMKEIEAVVSAHFDARDEVSKHDLILEVAVSEAPPAGMRMVSRPPIDPAALSGLRSALTGIDPPAVRGAPVSFQLGIAVSGGTGLPWPWQPEAGECDRDGHADPSEIEGDGASWVDVGWSG